MIPRPLLSTGLLLVLLAGCTEKTREPMAVSLSPASHRDLQELFRAQSYTWDRLENGVPPFILENLPADIDRIRSVRERKGVFFLSLLPSVLILNEQIANDRETLVDLLAAAEGGQDPSPEEMLWLTELAADYRVAGDPLDNAEARATLLRRLDVIPPSLALAQAANESAYGTSRFALQGNNLFGEWTFTPGAGIVPEGRPDGHTYEVRKFATVYDSIRSYFRNLNTNKAYLEFRLKRASLREKGRDPRGLDLVGGLSRYSIRGQDYVREIAALIRQNGLYQLSGVSLRDHLDPQLPAGPASGTGLYSSASFSRRASLARVNP